LWAFAHSEITDENLTEADIDDMIKKAGVDNDGRVSLEICIKVMPLDYFAQPLHLTGISLPLIADHWKVIASKYAYIPTPASCF
jgi:hypothetical protein